MNIRLTVEYNGAAYSGWQRQKNAPSVQETLEKAAAAMCGHPVGITAAGRTDAGVHALGQVCNFHTHCTVPPQRMARVLNTLLPPDIRVTASETAAEGFNARFDAQGKRYRYTIFRRAEMNALLWDRAWHVPGPLDEDAMARAARVFTGSHDFVSFMAAGSSAKTTVRTVTATALERRGDRLVFDIAGTGFLYNMVRIIVGTLVEVGRGRRGAESVAELFSAADRTLAGFTAPSQGLCLLEVYYGAPPPDRLDIGEVPLF